MPLFDPGPRTDESPKRHSERMLAFLNRSARVHAQRVRDALEQWFQRYPTSEQAALKRRLETDFDSPAFELVLHEILCQSGYAVDVEPKAATRPTHPDFHATRARTDGTAAGAHASTAAFYLEAIVASDTTAEERKRAAVKDALYDAINAHPSRDYWLRLRTFDIQPGTQPAPKHIKAFLDRAFASTDWTKAVAALQAGGLQQARRVAFGDNTLRAEFELIPKSAAARGAADARSIGMYPIEIHRGDAVAALQRAFTVKAEKYGDLGAPFVIAINSASEFGTARFEFEQALYGYEEVPGNLSGGQSQLVRIGPSTDPRGMFDPTRPARFKRVSAVLAGTVHATVLGESTLTVYHNPWATRPLAADTLQLPQVTLLQDAAGPRFVRTPGMALTRVLALPDGWPQHADES